MTDDFDPAPAAALLADHWRSGVQLTELPPAIRPRTMLDGYAVQDSLVELLGEGTVGWKLGLGSEKQKRQLGVGRSVAGQVIASHCHEAGATITLPNRAPVTVELEIAYVLGRDILPEESSADPIAAVAETRVTFELLLSRFVDRRAVGWPSFAADNAGFEALVVGPAIGATDRDALAEGVVVSAAGREMAFGLRGEDRTDPGAAFRDLVALACERHLVLPRGSIISTGAVATPFEIAAIPTEVSASFFGMTLGFRTVIKD